MPPAAVILPFNLTANFFPYHPAELQNSNESIPYERLRVVSPPCRCLCAFCPLFSTPFSLCPRRKSQTLAAIPLSGHTKTLPTSKITNTGSHAIVWTHENTAHAARNGYNSDSLNEIAVSKCFSITSIKSEHDCVIKRVLKNATCCTEHKRGVLHPSTRKSESFINGRYAAWTEQHLLLFPVGTTG